MPCKLQFSVHINFHEKQHILWKPRWLIRLGYDKIIFCLANIRFALANIMCDAYYLL